MTRSELEHLLRASAAIVDDDDIVVIGSQSVLGRHPDAPAVLLASAEADLYPRNRPERAILIDGAIGEGSYFHETFGYYAQGVGPDTATLPRGWQRRLVGVSNHNTGGATGWCLDTEDLAVSKYVAGRDKDRVFTAELAHAGLTGQATLLKRLAAADLDEALRAVVSARIGADFRDGR